MDILLVNAAVKAPSKHARLSPPLGLAYIASVLLQHGYGAAAEDLNLSRVDPDRMTGLLTARAPRIVGISAQTETYPSGLRLAEAAKRANPETTVVMGGPHATVMYEQVLREKSIDIVVRGEGEHAMLELADHLLNRAGRLDAVRGIAFRRGGKITATPERPFVADPDDLPFPARASVLPS